MLDEKEATTGEAGMLPILERIEQHSRTLDRAIALTQMADAKTAPVLALQATLAAVTVTQSHAARALLNTGHHLPIAVALACALLAAYAATAALACVLAILVYLPRSPRPSQVERHGPTSLVHFDDIRRMPKDLFQERAVTVDMVSLERDILTQVHTVSSVAALKMGYVRVALILTIASFATWLPLVAWAQA